MELRIQETGVGKKGDRIQDAGVGNKIHRGNKKLN